MTFLAIGAEVGFVRVLMTSVAVTEGHAGKALEVLTVPGFLFMALDTGHVFMPAREGKIRFVVVKLSRRGKFIRGVAFRAIVRQGVLVVVGVAGFTIPLQPQIGVAPFFQFRVIDQTGGMAFPAIGRFMGARELVTREAVVEFILVEMHQVEIPAVMVVVATRAFFSFGLIGSVVTGPLIQFAFYFFMATQAFVVRNLIAQYMAFGTIGDPLQMRMRLRQVAGRQLGFRPESQAAEQHCNMEDSQFQ